MSLLEVGALEVHYGGIRAVKGIDLRVEPGELVCLIGANGAGKSSTLRAICGLLHGVSGRVRYQGADISALPVHERPRRGLVMVPEGRGIFPQLTVAENLAMGAYSRRDAEVQEDLERAYRLFGRLAERRTQTGGTLSGGEQQMLAIGRALMSRPKLLLLDEPSMGLSPMVLKSVFEAAKQMNSNGATVLLVEQNARAGLRLSHRGVVMENGTVRLSGTGREVLEHPEIGELYLGGAVKSSS